MRSFALRKVIASSASALSTFNKEPAFRRVFVYLWRLGVLTCLAKTGAVADLFKFSDYFSDYIFEEIARSEINSVGGCYGWS